MEVREATVEDAATVLAFVQAKAQFDRELGAFAGSIGDIMVAPSLCHAIAWSSRGWGSFFHETTLKKRSRTVP